MVLVTTVISIGVGLAIYLAYDWGSTLLRKYKKDNDLN